MTGRRTALWLGADQRRAAEPQLSKAENAADLPADPRPDKFRDALIKMSADSVH
jgi:hypothetical protein